MDQVNRHSKYQVMHGLYPKRLADLVLGSMPDHEKLAMEVLENEG